MRTQIGLIRGRFLIRSFTECMVRVWYILLFCGRVIEIAATHGVRSSSPADVPEACMYATETKI
jgi:hypothetical protein